MKTKYLLIGTVLFLGGCSSIPEIPSIGVGQDLKDEVYRQEQDLRYLKDENLKLKERILTLERKANQLSK